VPSKTCGFYNFIEDRKFAIMKIKDFISGILDDAALITAVGRLDEYT
jgi:hypothetical protein